MSNEEIRVPVPLDDDGFLRRECPACGREFKWFYSEDSEPVPTDGYACPYCAQTADADSWFTQAQIDVVHDAVGREIVDPMLDEFGREMRHASRGSFVQVDVTSSPRPPRPQLTEPNDMTRVDPSCHPKEPIKVLENWTDTVHCIVCAAPIRDAA